MKRDMLYNQVNPLIRMKELELLTPETWEQLINAADSDGVKEILKNTVYNEVLSEHGFPGDFEHSLAEHRRNLYAWAYEIAPESELVSIYARRYTFHNLKVLTKAEVTGKNLDQMFLYDGQYTLAEMESAIRTKRSSILAPNLMEAIQEVLAYMEGEDGIIPGIDVIYDRYYLEDQRQLAEKVDYPELLDEVKAYVDLTNISILARGIIQEQSKGFLNAIIADAGRLPKKELIDFARKDLKDFIAYLKTTRYHELFEPLIVGDNEFDVVQLDIVKDDYLAKFYDQAETIAFGPLPLLNLLNDKEQEARNLRLIVVGKRSGFSKELIRERMRRGNGL